MGESNFLYVVSTFEKMFCLVVLLNFESNKSYGLVGMAVVSKARCKKYLKSISSDKRSLNIPYVSASTLKIRKVTVRESRTLTYNWSEYKLV